MAMIAVRMPKTMVVDSDSKVPAAFYPWLAHYPTGVDWHAELPEKPLFAILDQAMDHYGDRPFLDFYGFKCTYKETGAIVEQLAGALQTMGVGGGVKVGLLLPNSPYFVFCYFAILKAGGTVVLYDPRLAADEIARQIEDSETDMMVTLDVKRIYSKVAGALAANRLRRLVVCRLSRTLPLAKRILSTLLKLEDCISIPEDDVHIAFEQLLCNPSEFKPVEIDPRQDIAALLYTGGTTGEPKGVCLSHSNLYANAYQGMLGLPSSRRGHERVLAVIPFFHAFGMTAGLNTSVALGAEIVLLPRFDPKEVLKSIHTKQPSMFLGVPTIFASIVNHQSRVRYDLSSLRLCTCGGDSLPMDVRKSFQELASCDLVEGYGLTECSPVVTCASPLGLDKPRSIGVPLPGTLVKIVSLEDQQTPLGPDELGEICVKGPQVMRSYWRKPAATARALQGGWLHTGDVGSMDEDGYFYLVDRIKDVIVSGGIKVYPAIVEAAIAEHPAVKEVAVVGLPHPHWGEQVTAFLARAGDRGLSKDELLEFLKDKLSSYELPKSVHFFKELPKSEIGKVLKVKLRRTYGGARQD